MDEVQRDLEKLEVIDREEMNTGSLLLEISDGGSQNSHRVMKSHKKKKK
jgi:hypothetical protein